MRASLPTVTALFACAGLVLGACGAPKPPKPKKPLGAELEVDDDFEGADEEEEEAEDEEDEAEDEEEDEAEAQAPAGAPSGDREATDVAAAAPVEPSHG